VTARSRHPARIKDKDDAALGSGLKQIAFSDEAVKRKRLSFREQRGAAALITAPRLQRDEDARW